MPRFTGVILTLSGLAITFGCAPSEEEPQALETANAEATVILEKFQSVIDQFSVETNPELAADIYLSMHTPDAILMLPGSEAIEGREALRPFIVDFASAYALRFENWVSEEWLVSGDLAVHRFSGVAEMIPRSEGDTLRQDRKYMDIWRKSPDGDWLIARHMFNLNQ
jgi:ketosteroid isomerase-like protein